MAKIICTFWEECDGDPQAFYNAIVYEWAESCEEWDEIDSGFIEKGGDIREFVSGFSNLYPTASIESDVNIPSTTPNGEHYS